MVLCRGCGRYLQSGDFSPSASARLSGRCRDCTGLDNIARPRNDFSCYKYILRRLRADEQRLNKEAKIPFLLQVADVRYLVDVVWASCSALQASSDLYSLVFVRWERERDWSPWNCILLTKEEASAHLEVEDVHKVCLNIWINYLQNRKCRLTLSDFAAAPNKKTSSISTAGTFREPRKLLRNSGTFTF